MEGHEEDRLASAGNGRAPAESSGAAAGHRRRQATRIAVFTSIVLAVLLSAAGLWLVRETRCTCSASARAEKAVAISQFLQRMLSSVDPRRKPEGRNVKVADTLDEAIRELDSDPLPEQEVEAALRWTIGNAYKSLGLLPAAEAQLQKAWIFAARYWGPIIWTSRRAWRTWRARSEFEGKAPAAKPLYEESRPSAACTSAAITCRSPAA